MKKIKKWTKNVLQMMEVLFGTHKKVTDLVSGKTHKVPVREIIVYGLKQQDLKKYPEVDQKSILVSKIEVQFKPTKADISFEEVKPKKKRGRPKKKKK